MTTSKIIIEEMTSLGDEGQARHLSRFFKTGKGEYGEGDRFLGIKVPVTRSIVKCYKDKVSVSDIDVLVSSCWHEVRLAGFFLLTELYKKAIRRADILQAKNIVDYYVANISKGNNWDLVDLVAYNILGDWVSRFPEDVYFIEELSQKEGFLWHQRVSIVSTMALIRNGSYDLTFKMAEKFINHPHDLIQKATGWMLREVGKRGGKEQLVEFLERHKATMARTTLRYAIERFTEEERKYFMTK